MSSVRRTADDAEYTLTWVVSEPGGVAGIESASFQRDELATNSAAASFRLQHDGAAWACSEALHEGPGTGQGE